MRQGGREGGGSPGQGAADTQTVQVVHSCIPRQHCTALFHHRTALLCRAMHSGLSVQDSNLCCAAVCHWKCTLASGEPDLKVTPPKCFFINRPVWTPPAAFVPRTAARHFVQRSRLCRPAGCCAQAAAAAAGSMQGLGDIGLWSGVAGAWIE